MKKEGSDLQVKIDNLRVDLAASNKKFEDLKDASEKDKKLLEAEIARLKKEGLNRGESSMEELEVLRKELQRVSDENEELRKEIASKDREYDKLQNISNTTLEEKKELEDKLNYMRDVCNQLTKDNTGKKLFIHCKENSQNIKKTLARAEAIDKHLQEISSLNAKIAEIKLELKRFDGIVRI